ncbi:TPA: hypothetical protein HA235_00355 [Candidatus Woesearchaeota archaeon]|nr:hypothetical protein [Candidatus Woesearchaeota archaeon]HIH31135.1 hypothetical protein [Candidatus Woesearchaeota archaeon]HIH54616.1 hypothetical protein [Candidatus Woesearchaeota archaeon]HIJ02330.1 hypothetical protein [Candidatus Woesearchaeota archaeon]HIJ14192.1 hypothetical protein [Candidatus Woesearchaeota archaeon]
MFNETVNAASTVVNQTLNYLSTDFFSRILAILEAPIKNPQMLWMLLPLLATAILIEFYFGRYKDEELGWNTAYGNALVLAFISIDLLRHTYEPLGLTIRDAIFVGNSKIFVALIIFSFALLLLFIDFFHFLPKKLAYAISSPAYINFLGLIGIMLVYSSKIPLDWTTFGACLVILILFIIIAELLYLMVPTHHSPINRILTVDDKEKKKN